jgi:dCMP deaminase
MFSACLASKRSKDPNTKVGAVIVNNENRIIATGYNGFPNGIKDELLPWTKDSELYEKTKYAYVVHAEANCLLNSVKSSLKGCIMYVTLFPCSSCTKLIIQKGIKKIVFSKNCKKPESGDHKASVKMLELAGVEMSEYKGCTSINLTL